MLVKIPELKKIKKSQWLRVLEYTWEQTQEIEELISHHVWITAYRKQIYVRAMSTSHINNCINCWEGNGKTKIPPNYLGGKDKWLSIFREELIKRL